MPYKIRRVDTSDEEIRDAINRMDRLCFEADELCDKDGYWWIAYSGKTPVAFAGLKKSRQWDGCGYLCRVGVVPSHRGKGLQRRLIQVRRRYAKNNLRWRWLVTDTTGNHVSGNNLISSGFRLYNPVNPWGPKDAIYWKLEL